MYDAIAALVARDGWRAEGAAARVHYEGAGDRFAVEYYAPTDAVLYWSVPTDGDVDRDADPDGDTARADRGAVGTATPIRRDDVPDPLRKRIRADLSAAGVDPAVERRSV
ncbi:DUF7538 family protein [Halorubrum vacuolatum]|uniref:Dehydrogenase n=1 Tax=Halorubrum vacuolatum TaxID=63740 RepID=A0A238XLP7_HALVU|nr:hypothetical protein [Halorubrum vacuolatum]SNR59630.1 hypothetical protein SAMN06264855_11945 [Halorubrum vacuolatum]